jgi:hypothetical protein
MSGDSFNPYAPPRDAAAPLATSVTALPPGFRRFRLDPVAYGPFVTGIFVRRVGLVAVMTVVMLALFNAAVGQSPTATAGQCVGALIFGGMITMARRRGVAANELRAYELLLGPRVLRRVGTQLGPAEILRPEVTQIAETREGLWLSSQAPKRSLFIARAVDGYADVRAELAGWRPIESVSGWSAWRLTSRAAKQQGHRDAVIGTALASDPSLSEELEIARAVSSATHVANAPPKRRPFLWVLVLWGILIFMFLGIWTFLTPAQSSTPSRAPSSHGGP